MVDTDGKQLVDAQDAPDARVEFTAPDTNPSKDLPLLKPNDDPVPIALGLEMKEVWKVQSSLEYYRMVEDGGNVRDNSFEIVAGEKNICKIVMEHDPKILDPIPEPPTKKQKPTTLEVPLGTEWHFCVCCLPIVE